MRLKAIYFITIFLLFIYLPFADRYMDKNAIIILLLVAAGSLSLFFLRKETNENIKGRFLKHSTFVLFGICVVHFQVYIDYLLGNIDSRNATIWLNRDIVVKALTLSVIGLVSFLLGYLFCSEKVLKKKTKVSFTSEGTRVLEFLAFSLLTLYFYLANPLYFLGGYGTIDIGQNAIYVSLVFEIFMIVILIQKSRNLIADGMRDLTFIQFIKSIGVVNVFLLSVYLLSVLFSGDRGPLIFFSLAIFGTYINLTHRKIKFVGIFILFFLATSFITVLGEVRSLEAGNKSFIEKIFIVLEQNKPTRFGTSSFSPQTQELSLSAMTLNQAVNTVPYTHDFFYGRFQLVQIISILPFGYSFIEMLFDNTEWQYGDSAKYITWLDHGDHPESGDGTTVIADFYLDFGGIGVIIGMLMFGYMIRYAELKMYSNQLQSFFVNSFFIVFLCYSIDFSRATVLVEFKQVCWATFILAVNKLVFNRRKVKKLSLIS